MPKIRSTRKRRSLAQIATVMDGFKGSELSVAEIARRAGVSVPTIYQWKRRLGMDGTATGSAESGPMVRVIAANWPPTTLTASPPVSGALSLAFASGLVCRVEPGFDEQTLLRLVNLLAVVER